MIICEKVKREYVNYTELAAMLGRKKRGKPFTRQYLWLLEKGGMRLPKAQRKRGKLRLWSLEVVSIWLGGIK